MVVLAHKKEVLLRVTAVLGTRVAIRSYDELRDCIENSVLSMIIDWLLEYQVCPAKWNLSHLEANTRPKLYLNFEESKAYKTKAMK